MVTKIITQKSGIVIGVDVSTIKHNVCVVDALDGQILYEDVFAPPTAERYQKLFVRLPGCQITVAYEAGPDGYALYDLMREMGNTAVVVAPQKHVGCKTDTRDARHIARDFLARRTTRVCVPDFTKRNQRQVLRTRDQLMKERRRTMNRIASLQRVHGLSSPGLRTVEYDPCGFLDIAQQTLRDMYQFLTQKIKELEVVLDQIVKQNADYRELSRELNRLPGVGRVTTWQVLLNVADLEAFDTAAQFASYTGLCPGIYSTGKTQRHGRITRRGPGPVRAALVQAAWACVRSDPKEKEFFTALSRRRGKKKAIVAVARRLAQRIWRVARTWRNAPPPADGACAAAPA